MKGLRGSRTQEGVIFWALLLGGAEAAAQEPAAPQGPAAYYKLDETSGTTAVDSAGGVNGTYTGTPTPSTNVNVPPISYPDLRSLSFNGSNQCVTIPNFGSFSTMSVAAWVNRSGTSGGRQSIVSYKEGNGVNMGFVLCLNEDGSHEYPRIWVQVNGGWTDAESTAGAVPQGTWTHLVGTYDGTTITLYVNGAQVATLAKSGAMTNTGSQNCVIGGRADSTSNLFPGLIDDVRIYSRALTSAEVATLAAGCPVPTGLTATASSGKTSLSWTAPSGPAPGYTYNVKRGTASGAETTIATGIAGTTYVDSAVAGGVTYYYVVTAVSAAESGHSNEASCLPIPVSVSPSSLTVVEAGGMATFTVSLLLPLANGAPLSTVATVTSAAPSAPILLSTGGAPAASLPIAFTGNGSSLLSQTVTVIGVDDFIAANPWTATITFSMVSSSDLRFSGVPLTPVTVNQIESDFPGIIVTPSSGLSTTNGGSPVTFTVQLSSKPTSPVSLPMTVSIPYQATVAGPSGSTLSFDASNWNIAQPVTITPQAVNTQTTYVTSYEIDFTPVASLDASYAGFPVAPLPVFEATSTPPLNKVWHCGLLGLDGLLPLGLAVLWRRRRRDLRDEAALQR